MNAAVLRSRTFLIGPHGAGKSSIGRELAQHGYQHFSVGTVARLVQRRRCPSDIPGRLRLALASHEPGTPLGARAVNELIAFLKQQDRIVVDGFPATTAHLAALNELDDWSVVYVHTPRQQREERLTHRAETTLRKWVPGRKSERDLALPDLCRSLRDAGRLSFFDNSRSPIAIDELRGVSPKEGILEASTTVGSDILR